MSRKQITQITYTYEKEEMKDFFLFGFNFLAIWPFEKLLNHHF